MSDPGHRPGNADSKPEYEAGELRRRHEEEFRRERDRRTAEPASDVPKATARDVPWKPPPEMSNRGKRALVRVLLFVVIVAGLYFTVTTLSELLFAPKLTLLQPVVPTGSVAPSSPVTIGVYARNEKMRQGAAYALLILEDGSEVEGPVVIVPPRDSVFVPVQVSLPPGDHVATLVLYDAWRENVEVAAVHGVLIRSGMPEVDVVQALIAPVAQVADSIVVQLSLANRMEWEASVQPLVVFTPASGGGQPIEVNLGRIAVPAGQTVDAQRSIPPGTVPQGSYLVAVVNVTDSGDRTGTGAHGIPFTLPSRAPSDRR